MNIQETLRPYQEMVTAQAEALRTLSRERDRLAAELQSCTKDCLCLIQERDELRQKLQRLAAEWSQYADTYHSAEKRHCANRLQREIDAVLTGRECNCSDAR